MYLLHIFVSIDLTNPKALEKHMMDGDFVDSNSSQSKFYYEDVSSGKKNYIKKRTSLFFLITKSSHPFQNQFLK